MIYRQTNHNINNCNQLLAASAIRRLLNSKVVFVLESVVSLDSKNNTSVEKESIEWHEGNIYSGLDPDFLATRRQIY